MLKFSVPTRPLRCAKLLLPTLLIRRESVRTDAKWLPWPKKFGTPYTWGPKSKNLVHLELPSKSRCTKLKCVPIIFGTPRCMVYHRFIPVAGWRFSGTGQGSDLDRALPRGKGSVTPGGPGPRCRHTDGFWPRRGVIQPSH